MSYVLTLVASNDRQPLSEGHLTAARRFLENQGLRQTCSAVWLHEAKAAETGFSSAPSKNQFDGLRNLLATDKIDCFFSSVAHRRKKMLIADMDSTVITTETLDELAQKAGIKEEISAITKMAMEGEIDFHTALRKRVSLLKGLSLPVLQQTLDETVLNEGAEILARVMNFYGARTILVTGGFTFFSEHIAKKAGFHNHHANVLEIESDKLTGKVRKPVLDKNAKLKTLYDYCEKLSIKPGEVLALGDGANDLPMLKAAGLGIGYHPKQLLVNELYNLIIHGDLTAALYAQGYSEQHIREAIS
jgi:phosphoserine phosphatase